VQTIDPKAGAAMLRVPHFSVAQVLDQFRAALIARDIIPPDPILADGCLHRCHAAGRNGRGDAAYVLHLDGLPAGGFENHRDGRDWETWCFDLGRTATAAEREVFARVTHAARIRRDDDAQQHLDEVRSKAEHIWVLARPAPDTHPYLARKAAGAIDKACIESACRIVNWHLHEACRLLADLDAPPDLAAATRFDAWLRGEAARTGDPRITSARIYQYGPGCVRDGNALRAALALLEERGRARVEQEGRRRFVAVNPALLDHLDAQT
jgi:hypothetical protein